MNTKILAFIFVLCAVIGGGSYSTFGQVGDRVLVAGAKPLRQSDVDRMIEFYEWAFEVKFTAQQHERMRESMEGEFRTDAAQARAGIDDVMASYAKVKALSPAEQEAKREKFAPAFVENLRKATGDPTSELLVSIYDEAHGGGQSSEDASTATAADSGRSPDAPVGNISAIVGGWVWARSGSSTYTTGGSYMGSNGSRFTYKFLANGSVEYTGIMNVMTGGCRMQVFTAKKGRANLSGGTLTINWAPADFSRDDSCSPSKNYKKKLPAETETFKVRFQDSYGQRQLCMTGKDETCFSPES
jgi:hypothetical protein